MVALSLPSPASRHRLVIMKEKVPKRDEPQCGTASWPVQGVRLNSTYTADILFSLLLRPAVSVGQACTRLPSGSLVTPGGAGGIEKHRGWSGFSRVSVEANAARGGGARGVRGVRGSASRKGMP